MWKCTSVTFYALCMKFTLRHLCQEVWCRQPLSLAGLASASILWERSCSMQLKGSVRSHSGWNVCFFRRTAYSKEQSETLPISSLSRGPIPLLGLLPRNSLTPWSEMNSFSLPSSFSTQDHMILCAWIKSNSVFCRYLQSVKFLLHFTDKGRLSTTVKFSCKMYFLWALWDSSEFCKFVKDIPSLHFHEVLWPEW